MNAQQARIEALIDELCAGETVAIDRVTDLMAEGVDVFAALDCEGTHEEA